MNYSFKSWLEKQELPEGVEGEVYRGNIIFRYNDQIEDGLLVEGTVKEFQAHLDNALYCFSA